MARGREKSSACTFVVKRLFQMPDGRVLTEEELTPEQKEAFKPKISETIIRGWVESERKRHRHAQAAGERVGSLLLAARMEIRRALQKKSRKGFVNTSHCFP